MNVYTFIEIGSIILETSLLFWLLSTFFKPKWNKYLTPFIMIAASLLEITLTQSMPVFVRTVFSLLSFVMYGAFFFHGSLKGKIFVAFCYLLSLLTADLLSVFISSQMNLQNVMDSTQLRYVWQVASRIILAVVVGFISLLWSMKKVGKIYVTNLLLFAVVPIINAILLIVFYQDKTQEQEILEFAIFAALSTFTFIILATNVIYRIQSIEHENDARYAKRERELQQKYFQEIEKVQQEVRNNLHDINHHMQGIRTFIEQKEHKLAEKYFVELDEHLQKQAQIAEKENVVIQALIDEWKKKAEEKEIEVLLDIKLKKNVMVPMLDLSVLIGNTFSNAIEACGRSTDPEKKKIWCQVWDHQGVLFYQLKNTAYNSLRINGNRFLSTKTDGGLHGIGLISVEQTVEKYGGILEISSDDEYFTLMASLMERE